MFSPFRPVPSCAQLFQLGAGNLYLLSLYGLSLGISGYMGPIFLLKYENIVRTPLQFLLLFGCHVYYVFGLQTSKY